MSPSPSLMNIFSTQRLRQRCAKLEQEVRILQLSEIDLKRRLDALVKVASRLRAERDGSRERHKMEKIVGDAWVLAALDAAQKERHDAEFVVGMPLKDQKFFRLRAVELSGLFDETYYRSKNEDLSFADMAPFEHYIASGAKEGRPPGPAFDGEAYLTANDDVRAMGLNPLVHFVTYGCAEGRHFDAPPAAYHRARSAETTAPRQVAEPQVAEVADADQAETAELPKLKIEHAVHEDNGGDAGRLQFDGEPSRSKRDGSREHHKMEKIVGDAWELVALAVRKGGHDAEFVPSIPLKDQEFFRLRAAELSGLFDETYYRSKNEDLSFANISAFNHYIASGAKEGRPPSPAFDGEAYLAANDDVRGAGLNPLVHFVTYGCDEGRHVSAPPADYHRAGSAETTAPRQVAEPRNAEVEDADRVEKAELPKMTTEHAVRDYKGHDDKSHEDLGHDDMENGDMGHHDKDHDDGRTKREAKMEPEDGSILC